MILVTGMHRSGTSLVAMTMEALGVSFGPHSAFYAADRWNARGYFERRDVMDINSRMISGFRRTGSRSAALLGQLRYLTEPSVETVVARGESLSDEMVMVGHEIGDGAIKDPRLCLTWSAWSKYAEIDSCVVCIRHPFDVADSLRRRQNIPMPLGFRFWRYHMKALRDLTPPRIAVVHLESLVSTPEAEIEMLSDAIDLEIDAFDAAQRFRSIYNPGMVKTISRNDRPPLDLRTGELWKWLVDLRPLPIAGSSE